MLGGVQFERWLSVAIVIAYGALAVGFSFGPIFEGPDEIEHYRYVQTLVETRALPDPAGQMRGEYHQAPLYYMLLAPVAALIDDDDFIDMDGRLNPYYGVRIHLVGNDNKNIYLHSRAESFPYDQSATAASVHLLRLISVLLGVGTLLVSRAIFRVLWPGHAPLRVAALALVAYWPQFLYLSSVINPDTLLIFLATLTLYWLLVLLRDGPSRRASLLLGVTLGALLLTKVSAVFVAIPVGVALLLDRRAWRSVPLIVLIVVGVAGWWYARNTILYGDPANTQAVLETWEAEVIDPGGLAFDIALERVPFAYETLWARFGQGAVPVGAGIYRVFDLLLIAAGTGMLWRVWRQVRARRIGAGGRYALVVAVFVLTWIGALFYWAATAWSGNQGRYLLPGIAAMSAMIVYGVFGWLPRRFQWGGALSGVIGLAAVAALSLFGYFLPAYRPASVPDTIQRSLLYRYGDVAELTGVAFDDTSVLPGEPLEVTLYWRAIQPAEQDLLVYLHSVEAAVVRRESYPGNGNVLATEWRAGDIWAEHYVVEIPAGTTTQTAYSLIVGLYDPASETDLPVVDADGNAITPVIGEIGISRAGALISRESDYVLGDVIGLDAIQIADQDDQLEVCLQWRALSRVKRRYTTFVHVLGSGLEPMPQADVQPPYPTDLWAERETVAQCITLAVAGLPDQGWLLAIGMYDLTTLQRLPIRQRGGDLLPDDAITVIP